MQILQPQAKIVPLVLGTQKLNNGKKYRLLRFCMRVKYEQNELIFNNLTKELIFLEGAKAKLLDGEDLNIAEEPFKALAEKWFLVPEENDDMKLCDQLRAVASSLKDKTSVHNFNLVTTTACNARCFYCFEAGAKVSSMSKQTALDAAKFMHDMAKGKKIRVHWFGGEPLCNVGAINEVVKFFKENKVEFISNITTNGYLFDEKNVAAAKEWNLQYAQITLDGLADTYNKIKSYVVKDENHFDTVIKNIENLLNAEITVVVRLNMDSSNSDELYSLVDFLSEKFGQYKNFAVYAHLIYEKFGFVKSQRSQEERQSLEEKFFALRKYIEERLNYASKTTLPDDVKTSHCMADSHNSMLISPDGKIGNCEGFVDSKFYGDISTTRAVTVWDEYLKYTDCETCPCYPSCIRLKGCPNYDSVCHSHERRENLLNLKKQIVTAANKFFLKNI